MAGAWAGCGHKADIALSAVIDRDVDIADELGGGQPRAVKGQVPGVAGVGGYIDPLGAGAQAGIVKTSVGGIAGDCDELGIIRRQQLPGSSCWEGRLPCRTDNRAKSGADQEAGGAIRPSSLEPTAVMPAVLLQIRVLR